MGVPVYWPLSVLCVCVLVISNQSTSKKPHVSDLSKHDDALLHKTHIKVLLFLRYMLDMCRSILSLSKIAHQLWRDLPFSQRNKTTEKTIGVEVRGDREMGKGRFEKGVKQYGGLHNKGRLEPLCQLCKETKNFLSSIIKPTPYSWLSPIFSKNFPSPLLEPFLKNPPLLMKIYPKV